MRFKLKCGVKRKFGQYEEITFDNGKRALLSTRLDPKEVIAVFQAKKLWVFVILQKNESHFAEIQIFRRGAGIMCCAPALMSALPGTAELFAREFEKAYSYIGSINLPCTNGPDARNGWVEIFSALAQNQRRILPI